MAPSEKEVWFGSIPPGHSEDQVLCELAAYGLRPWKVVLRFSQEGSQATR